MLVQKMMTVCVLLLCVCVCVVGARGAPAAVLAVIINEVSV